MEQAQVLTVINNHVEECGKPPGLTTGKGHYTAYFENLEGEQLVFQYNRKEHKCVLWHGDLGWDKPQDVKDGIVPDIILSREEKIWLKLVWAVASGR